MIFSFIGGGIDLIVSVKTSSEPSAVHQFLG